MDAPIHSVRKMRIICIGAGAAGLCFAYKLQRSFENFELVIYERNSGVGGVWFENTYPGCACDFPAHNYTYSFEPKADWPRSYAYGPEIREYFEQFSAKYQLGQFCKTSHEVVGALWDSKSGTWQVDVKDLLNGTVASDRCHVLINATGVLSAWRWPDIPGLNNFRNPLLHTAKWDPNISLDGKNVGVIGNGSSGQQVVAEISSTVGHLAHFIRQPAWILGPFGGEEKRNYTDEEIETFVKSPYALLQKRKQFETTINGFFGVCLKDSESQAQLRQHLEAEMKKKISDPRLQDLLIPKYAVSCRRPTPGINYLEALTDIKTTVVYGDIKEIAATSVVDGTGKHHELDVLICATGFDTSYRPKFPLIGEAGQNLQDEWENQARAYMATSVAGFPNYFMFCGPHNPYGSGAYLSSVECQADYMLKFCDLWQTENIFSFSPKKEAVDEFIEHADLILRGTVWMDNCRSWYKQNTDDSSKLLLWPGSGLHFIEALSEIRTNDYNIKYSGNRFAWLGNGFSQTEMSPHGDRAFYIREFDDSPYLSKAKRRQRSIPKEDVRL